jgi:hypothetical protein
MNRVNAFIAIAFTVAVIAGFLLNTISTDAFIGIAGLCIGYFFPKSKE